jgi:hypothetical protein
MFGRSYIITLPGETMFTSEADWVEGAVSRRLEEKMQQYNVVELVDETHPLKVCDNDWFVIPIFMLLYLFVLGLFNDAFNSSDCIAFAYKSYCSGSFFALWERRHIFRLNISAEPWQLLSLLDFSDYVNLVFNMRSYSVKTFIFCLPCNWEPCCELLVLEF